MEETGEAISPEHRVMERVGLTVMADCFRYLTAKMQLPDPWTTRVLLKKGCSLSTLTLGKAWWELNVPDVQTRYAGTFGSPWKY